MFLRIFLSESTSAHTWNTETECIVSRKSHKRKVESMLHVATSLWVGWQATWVSSRSCPANDCRRAPLSTLYKLAVLQKKFQFHEKNICDLFIILIYLSQLEVTANSSFNHWHPLTTPWWPVNIKKNYDKNQREILK